MDTAMRESAVSTEDVEEDGDYDDFYEHIDAPKFFDFTAPNNLNDPAPDGPSWFCFRIGCNGIHKTVRRKWPPPALPKPLGSRIAGPSTARSAGGKLPAGLATGLKNHAVCSPRAPPPRTPAKQAPFLGSKRQKEPAVAAKNHPSCSGFEASPHQNKANAHAEASLANKKPMIGAHSKNVEPKQQVLLKCEEPRMAAKKVIASITLPSLQELTVGSKAPNPKLGAELKKTTTPKLFRFRTTERALKKQMQMKEEVIPAARKGQRSTTNNSSVAHFNPGTKMAQEDEMQMEEEAVPVARRGLPSTLDNLAVPHFNSGTVRKGQQEMAEGDGQHRVVLHAAGGHRPGRAPPLPRPRRHDRRQDWPPQVPLDDHLVASPQEKCHKSLAVSCACLIVLLLLLVRVFVTCQR